jgi:hypothetical protein
MQYRSKAIVRQPTGKLGLFDAGIPMFIVDSIDIDEDFQEIQQSMGHIGPRLLRAEIEFARQDVSWDDEEWTTHPEGLARWERCLQMMVSRYGVAHTEILLEESGLSQFRIPAWILDDDAERREDKTKSERRRRSSTEA